MRTSSQWRAPTRQAEPITAERAQKEIESKKASLAWAEQHQQNMVDYYKSEIAKWAQTYNELQRKAR